MENLDRKKNPQVEDIMVNTTFVMADAIDILLRMEYLHNAKI